jgi:hypothetical protein
MLGRLDGTGGRDSKHRVDKSDSAQGSTERFSSLFIVCNSKDILKR